ncbi:MAG: iron export ABC transporter permease subunit FetB [Candidatus Nanopelagicales bacterium]
MTSSAQVPTWIGVVASLSLVVLAAAVAWWGRLGLTRELLVAAARAFVQLVAVGALLGVVFTYGGLAAAFAWLAVMVVIGGQVAGRRASGLPGSRRTATAAIAVGAAATMGVLLLLRIIDATPTVVIPVGGMVVSGTMVATGLTLRRVRDDARRSRAEVEARLALGLPGSAAFAPHTRDSVRTALLPAIDQTKVVGLIALPGAMTGLILAGTPPLEAIRYQIVVMYMLLAAPALACAVAARMAERSLFDPAQRLRPLDLPG